jgi:hypothetical protein
VKTERRLSPEGTLKTASWGAANGTHRTPRFLRGSGKLMTTGDYLKFADLPHLGDVLNIGTCYKVGRKIGSGPLQEPHQDPTAVRKMY